MQHYDIRDWYWIVASDGTRVWSSRHAAYVPVADADYAAWAEGGATPTPIDTEANLKAVFAADFPQGWPVDLPNYARAKSYDIRIGGTTINGTPVKTDSDSLALINGMAALAKDDGTLTFEFDTGVAPVSLSAAQAIALSTAVGLWVQATFAKRATVLAQITSGSITTTDQIDAALA